MADRPDWLPEGFEYKRSYSSCNFCGALLADGRNEAWAYTYAEGRYGADQIKGVARHTRWCDSPECEQAAREAITGQADG